MPPVNASTDYSNNRSLKTRIETFDGPFSKDWDRALHDVKSGNDAQQLIELAPRLGWQARSASSSLEAKLTSNERLREVIGSLNASGVESARRLLALSFPQVRGLCLPAVDELVPALVGSSMRPLQSLWFNVQEKPISANALEALFADARFRGVRSLRIVAYESTSGVQGDALLVLAATPFENLESLELDAALSGDVAALGALVSAPWARGLRRLSLGPWHNGRRTCGDPLTGRWGQVFELLSAPLLEQLSLPLVEFSDRDLRMFAARPWPQLCRLELGGDVRCDARASMALFVAGFSSIRELHAECATLDVEGARQLVAQPWFRGLQSLRLADAGGGEVLERSGFRVETVGPFIWAERGEQADSLPVAAPAITAPSTLETLPWPRAWVALSIELSLDEVCQALEGWFPDAWVADRETWASVMNDAELPEIVVAVNDSQSFNKPFPNFPTLVQFDDLRDRGQRRAGPDVLTRVRQLARRFSEQFGCRAACDAQGVGRADDILVWEGGKAVLAGWDLSDQREVVAP